MHVARVFAATRLLSPAERFPAAVAVWDRRHLFPASADVLADASLPLGTPAWETLRRAVLAAIPRLLTDTEFTAATLGAVVPAIVDIDLRIESSPDVPQRLWSAAHLRRCRTWHDLASVTIADILRWRGVGATAVVQLLGAAIDLAWRVTVDPRPGASVFDAGTLFVGWSTDAPTHGAPSAGLPTTTDDPLGSHTVRVGDLGAFLDDCLETIDDVRARVAFELDDLSLDDPPRPGSKRSTPTAELLGLGPTRVLQLRQQARAAVAGAIAASPHHDDALRSLRIELGELCDAEHVDSVLARDGVAGGRGSAAGLLAMFAAGPYRPVAGFHRWWCTQERPLAADLARLLAEAGGVHDIDALAGDIESFGVDAGVARRWIARQHVRQIGELVISLAGSVTQVAARLLEATGRGLSASALADLIADGTPPGRLSARLERSPTFVRTGLDRWELADWGGAPTTEMVRCVISVTEAAFAGDEGPVPDELIGLLGLADGEQRRVPTRFGPLVIGASQGRAWRGSIRPLVLASGAEPGDQLVLLLSADGGVASIDVDRPGPASARV